MLFRSRRIRFTDIHALNAGTVEALAPRIGPVASLEDLLALDERARREARRRIEERST